jgi:flavin-dependent dehydrogenase
MGAGPHSGFAPTGSCGSPVLQDTHYDVVIAGASFAGLAVALSLRGHRVALVDRTPLGDGVTSACAAPVAIVHAMHADASVLQVHNRLVLHTPSTETVWPLPEPFCTFDYRQFCRAALAASGVEFVQSHVFGRRGLAVQTAAGDLMGTFLVEATGWRAVLAGGPASTYVDRRWMPFGIESEVAIAFDPGLHFYFLHEVRDGYAWAFPCAGQVRFGVLSYRGRSNLRAALQTFMARFGVQPGSIHGGFLASGLRSPVVDGVFVVGDASGHCLPLTGEGIRTALLGGLRCGDLLGRVLKGHLTVHEAEIEYRGFIEHSRQKFRALLWSTSALLALPLPVIGDVANWLSRPRPQQMFMQRYLSIFAESDSSLTPILADRRSI